MQPQRTWWIYLVLAAITLVPFLQTIHHGFISLDDPDFVTHNPEVQQGLTWSSVKWAFTTLKLGMWHPLTWLSLELDATLFGPENAWGFHLTNLLWHVANVLLLYSILGRLTQRPMRSAVVAALFAVHPMRVESVAWITERKDVVFLFFWLLALAAYLRYAARPSGWRYVLVLLMLALSLMGKTMAITFGCVMLLLDFWPLQRFEGNARCLKLLVLEKIPMLLLGLAPAIAAATYHTELVVHDPLGQRLTRVPVYYGWYLVKTIWPFELGLYPYPTTVAFGPKLFGSVVLLIFLSMLAWRLRHWQPAILVGWLWFLGTLVPVLGIVNAPVQVADRFTYLPCIGLLVAIVWGLADVAVAWKIPRMVQDTAAGVVLTICFIASSVQTGYWHDNIRLWEHSLAVNGSSTHVHEHLGHAYLANGEYARAQEQFELCLNNGFDPPAVYEGLGIALEKQGNRQAAEQLFRKYRARQAPR